MNQREKAFMPHLEAIITHHNQSAIKNEHLAIALEQLGSLYYYLLGQPQKSVRLYERALTIQEAHYERDHYQVAMTLGNLGNAYGALGDTARCRDLLERALTLQEAHYGRDHYEVAITLTNLGIAYGALGDTARKRDLLERALTIKEAHYGRDHYEVAITLTNLGNAYGKLGDTARKRDLLERALAILEAHYGRDHYQVAITLTNLAEAYHTLKQPRHALQNAQRAYHILMNHPQLGANHPRTKQCMSYLKSSCRFTLEDLQGKNPISAKEASALNHYPGALLNQGQRRKVRGASEEEKADKRKPESCCSCS